MEGGRAMLVLDVAAAELEAAITELLGACRPSGLGGLTRILPKAHPLFPWLYCERISNIQGLSPDLTASLAEESLEAPSLDTFQGYARYRLTCEFLPRPYAILSDRSVIVSLVSTANDAGTSNDVTVAQEWVRYLDVISEYKGELITAQQGMNAFWTNDTLLPNGKTAPGFPRIYLPNGEVIMRWYQVPERYVSSRNSNLKKYGGRVNQVAWDQWEAGELLYKGYRQKRYTPPVLWSNLPGPNDATIFGVEKLVDLEIVFEETARTIGKAYTPSNNNWVANGHNLQPYLPDYKFYYSGRSTADDIVSTPGAKRYPTFLSFEIGLLFTDPDVA